MNVRAGSRANGRTVCVHTGRQSQKEELRAQINHTVCLPQQTTKCPQTTAGVKSACFLYKLAIQFLSHSKQRLERKREEEGGKEKRKMKWNTQRTKKGHKRTQMVPGQSILCFEIHLFLQDFPLHPMNWFSLNMRLNREQDTNRKRETNGERERRKEGKKEGMHRQTDRLTHQLRATDGLTDEQTGLDYGHADICPRRAQQHRSEWTRVASSKRRQRPHVGDDARCLWTAAKAHRLL